MRGIIKVVNPVPGVSRIEIFQQACGENNERIFIVDVDDAVFKLKMISNIVWVGGATTYKVSSELITHICMLIKSHGK